MGGRGGAPRREPGAEVTFWLAPVVLRPRVPPETGGAAKSELALFRSPAVACVCVHGVHGVHVHGAPWVRGAPPRSMQVTPPPHPRVLTPPPHTHPTHPPYPRATEAALPRATCLMGLSEILTTIVGLNSSSSPSPSPPCCFCPSMYSSSEQPPSSPSPSPSGSLLLPPDGTAAPVTGTSLAKSRT